MRIAVLTNAYPPNAHGGAGKIAATQVKLLQSAGHETRVWVSSLDWINQLSVIRLSYHLMDLVYRFPRIDEILRWKPEVLITHNLTGCGWSSASAIQRKGVRWVHVLHDVQLFEPSGQLVSAEKITFWQKGWSALRRPVFSRPDMVVSPTKWLFEEHRRRGWFEQMEACVIPNPAPPSQVHDPSARSVPRVLFVGRFSPEKGSNVLTSLMETVEMSLEWHLIGSGTDRLDAYAFPSHARVIRHGVLDEAEILRHMCQMDVLLVPSQMEENQPTVLLEAAACGLPVIAAARGGIPETLKSVGMLVDSDRANAWRQALEYFMAHRHEPIWRERMESVWRRSSPERHLAALEEALKSKRNT